MYCTYLTVYQGNLLPPFYIGHAKLINVQGGYAGSVSSKKYKQIWKDELRENPHLFKVTVLRIFDTKKEALAHESSLQRQLRVHSNPLYVNMAVSNEKFFMTGPHPNKGGKQSEETKALIGKAAKRQFENPEARQRHLKAFLECGGNHVGKIWINDGSKNKRVTQKIFETQFQGWNKGRLLGDVKFYEHSNRKRDTITGKFIK